DTVTRPSVRATYNSLETGPRYHVITTINGWLVRFQPVPDPFVRTTVTVAWRDLLRGLLRRRRLVVEVVVGADLELAHDVLELDDQTLISGRTRSAAFRQSMHQRLRTLAEEGTHRCPLTWPAVSAMRSTTPS